MAAGIWKDTGSIVRRLYDGGVPAISTRRHQAAFGLVTASIGVALLFWLVRYYGPNEIWQGFRQIGWGLALIVALGGLRFATRAMGWCLCVEPPARLRFADAFAAVVAGDAIGNLTPLGPIVGEPAKAAFVRNRTSLAAAVTALAIENLAYTLSVAAMLAAATLALLFTFELPAALRERSEIGLAAVILLIGAAVFLFWRRSAVISRMFGMFARRAPGSPAGLERLQQLEQQIYSFTSRHKNVVVPLAATEVAFHALGVLEVYVTLWLLLGHPAPLLTAFVFEGTNRLITVVFKFVPLRMGVDEWGSAGLAPYVQIDPVVGTTLAIARKARMAIWALAGVVLLVREGLSARRILEDSQLTAGPNV